MIIYSFQALKNRKQEEFSAIVFPLTSRSVSTFTAIAAVIGLVLSKVFTKIATDLNIKRINTQIHKIIYMKIRNCVRHGVSQSQIFIVSNRNIVLQ